MKSRMQQLKPQRNQPKNPSGKLATRNGSRALDAEGRELIELFVMLLARSDYTRAAVMDFFTECLTLAPRYVGSRRSTAYDEDDRLQIDGPPYVLSVWCLCPPYVDKGVPRALPVYGPAPSIESIVRLVRRVWGLELTVEQAVDDLVQTDSIKRVGARYIPISRTVSYRMTPDQQRAHHLRMATCVLRTAEQNARKHERRRWFEFVADGGIPERQIEDFSKKFTEIGNQTLEWADAEMVRWAVARPARSRLAGVSACIVLAQDEPLRSLIFGRRRRNRNPQDSVRQRRIELSVKSPRD